MSSSNRNPHRRLIAFAMTIGSGLVFGYCTMTVVDALDPASQTAVRDERMAIGVPPASTTGLSYTNCAAARAAGAAPVRLGDRGYSRRLDRDADGIGCE